MTETNHELIHEQNTKTIIAVKESLYVCDKKAITCV